MQWNNVRFLPGTATVVLLCLEADKFLYFHQGNSLHMAARWGNLGAVKSLIKEGADINIQDNNGVSPETIVYYYWGRLVLPIWVWVCLYSILLDPKNKWLTVWMYSTCFASVNISCTLLSFGCSLVIFNITNNTVTTFCPYKSCTCWITNNLSMFRIIDCANYPHLSMFRIIDCANHPHLSMFRIIDCANYPHLSMFRIIDCDIWLISMVKNPPFLEAFLMLCSCILELCCNAVIPLL